MTKQEKLEKFVKKCVKSYNINQMSNGKDFMVLATMIGPLYIHRVESNRDMSSIFMSFEYPENASKYVNCNSYTGKWNIHCKKLDVAELLFEDCMQQLVDLRRM